MHTVVLTTYVSSASVICEDLGAEPLLVGCENLYDALIDYGSKIFHF